MGQKKPHENKLVFKLLVNKNSIRSIGDFDGRPDAFRDSARIWLPDETRPPPRSRSVRESLPSYQQPGAPDLEAVEDLHPRHLLPRRGAQVHFEYTCYAHYRLLRRLIGHAGKLRFFMDEDGALQAAFKTAFADRIRTDEVDGAAVMINKSLTVDERRALVAETKKLVDEYRVAAELGDLSDAEARLDMLGQEIATFIELLNTKDDRELKWIDPLLSKGWFWYPFNTMAEPHKRIRVLNAWRIKDDLHAARLMKRASLHAIDRFFMQIRRLIMMLERPISTPSNDGRSWRGYSAYNPRIIQKLLDIYRVYYNYVAVGEDKRTPAMRLGLAMGPVKLEAILYFDPLHSRLPEARPKPRRRAAPTGSLARPRRWAAMDPQ